LCVLALAAVGACATRPAPLAPEALPAVPRTAVSEWVDGYVPDHSTRYGLRWRYETQKGEARGRAVVRFVPPDSVRFDYRAPFGRSGAAVVVGDSVLWAEPEEQAGGFVAVATLFWAALGIPRHPPVGWAVSGRHSGATRVWRYTRGLDTLTYLAVDGMSGTLSAELVRGRELLGTVEAELGRSTDEPVKATMLFPSEATIVLFTVQAIEPLTSVAEDIWQRP
jgi:hypothetical protein